MTMAYRWPAGTAFKRITLDVEDCWCPVCDRHMHVCDHRYHHLWTLEGPTQVVNRLVRCPDAACESRGRTFSPEAELYLSCVWSCRTRTRSGCPTMRLRTILASIKRCWRPGSTTLSGWLRPTRIARRWC